MIDLFTYGSLMCADIMHRVAGCRARSTEAVLADFRRRKVSNEEYPGIVPCPGSMVSGVLYFHLADEAIRRLDIFEGELYDRQEVEVVSREYGVIRAMAYVIKPLYHDRLSNEAWSYDDFLAVGKARFEKAYLGFTKI
jgi:gamma-glutamylcyclotransferase (GGCT)/AIG2-like uncharacterized protein YtfP